MDQVQTTALLPGTGDIAQLDVRFVAGEDAAPTPTELLIASLATCVAFYAGRYLTRHGYSRDGLAVSAGFDMARDHPARVSGIHLVVRVPATLPLERWPAFRAVISHCTVHNTLTRPPAVVIELA